MVQPQHAVVVVDRHDVELAEHVGAEETLNTAVGVPERQVLLGSDMLSQFDIVTIDYDHSMLRLHHRAVKTSG